MHRIFGTSKKAANKATLDGAITSTDSRIDAVEVKIRKLEGELARYRDQMKTMRDGPGKTSVKNRALTVLKQKKMYETQRDQLQQQVFNMEQAQFTNDNIRNTMTTFEAMQESNKTLKLQYKNIDIDKIEDLQDEMADLMDQANEVQESIGRSYGVPDDLDEMDLEAELDALGEELDFESTEVPSYLQTGATTSDQVPDLLPEDEDPLKNVEVNPQEPSKAPEGPVKM
ncbi:Vacuolar protein-sorting-associated protein 60 [Tieghemiomyces parasiticus]|uniref:Vacuolar protein-sorting-associated protein 60 n=1 Tax=Tieghemiomyces parasiticus TaxID=78921 RepID=A0A9W8DW39_9FUNG|nr:Vacuolar protein-sorting-associated protein 60 [Tieghemiomyces parasiticus]KAJ1927139.1 Vacuolar protein-sorting-associated protein 60 [Tieghemiomyces parasiticus]